MRVAFFALVLSMTTGVFASWPFTFFGDNPKLTPQTLVITSNYKSPRLLAELIQYESKQPYLLLPAANRDDKIYLCMPRTLSKEVPASEVAMVVRQLNVRRIIVLGNQNYVSNKFLEQLGTDTPIVRIESNDWGRIAEEVGFMLNLSNIPSDYKKNRDIMLTDARIYRPTSMPLKNVDKEKTEKPLQEAPKAADDSQVDKVVVVE